MVCIDAMGTEWRSKSFHAAYDGNMGDNGLPDQVVGIRSSPPATPSSTSTAWAFTATPAEASRPPTPCFHYPDFFKVGISESGNHDNRDYEDDWAEKWQGLEVIKPDGSSNYDSQANQNLREKPERPPSPRAWHHGRQRPPQQHPCTHRRAHQGQQGLRPGPRSRTPITATAPTRLYMTRRRWDYFVRYLREDIPPPPYQMKSYDEVHRIMTSGP